MKKLRGKAKKVAKLKILAGIVVGVVLTISMFGKNAHQYFLKKYVGNKTIKVVNPLNFRNGGSGFYVKAPSGTVYIMTNRHVCELNSNNEVVIIEGNNNPKFFSRNIIKMDNKHDICIIEAEQHKSSLDVASRLDEGDLINLVGHPTLQPLTISKGEFIGSRRIGIAYPPTEKGCKKGDREFMFMCISTMNANQITAYSRGGSSGSPVVNVYGNLVGILFAGDRNDQFVTFMVPLRDIKRFLKDK